MEAIKSVFEKILDFLNRYVVTPFVKIDVLDIVDIILLAGLIYAIYRFSRNRRIGRVIVGMVIVVVGSIIVESLGLPTLSFIVRLFASSFFFCFVLIFQPEIREGLERIGNSRLAAPRSDSISKKRYPAAKQVVAETVDAVFRMSENQTGALIAFEGLTKLGEFIETGKIVDARVTSTLLRNIFFDKAPLHDGAVIIRDFKIHSASCVLPSTKSNMDFGNMGTRHRAAVGLTEVSDALVVVVSEQTGAVSVAQDGKIIRDFDREMLTDTLMTFLAGSLYLREKAQESKKRFFEQVDQVSKD